MPNPDDIRREPIMNPASETPLPTQVNVMTRNSKVVLTDIDIPFGRVVSIMTKWILASIPAAILAAIIFYVLMFLAGFVFGWFFPELGFRD